MTRSTASRAVAVFIIGAAISSGVLAAPAPSPMTPTMTGAQTQGLISRSSDGPVRPRNLLLANVAELSMPTIVPRQNANRLTFDEPEYGEDAIEPKVPVSVNLLKRGNTPSAAGGITKKAAIKYLKKHSSEASTYITSIQSEWDHARMTGSNRLRVLADKDRTGLSHGVRLRELFDTLNAAQDPRFNDLKTTTTNLWWEVVDWFGDQALVRITSKFNLYEKLHRDNLTHLNAKKNVNSSRIAAKKG
ncbi:hypothetical protein F5878DRAFT_713430 [Lentinula raphanica]|uniref:RxLR effector protein n=1 Tax=Lentinula raphanica TaxID=153919 RepID=A0AA38NYN8_9AGAR|nr:hypothetical protein F5878DRAFT_713430 [Lentinula raphanica]